MWNLPCHTSCMLFAAGATKAPADFQSKIYARSSIMDLSNNFNLSAVIVRETASAFVQKDASVDLSGKQILLEI